MAAFHAKMAQEMIRRRARGAEQPVHHHQNRRHLRPEHLLYHQVTLTEMNVMKQKVCHPGVCIYIPRIPTLNFSIIMHMPRIGSAMKILFQICWVHYLRRGNTADIDFEDESSHLSESESDDENWLERMGLFLATGVDNPPADWVWTVKTDQNDSRPDQIPNPPHLRGLNPDLYPSTCGICLVWLDTSIPIFGSVFRVFLFMVAFRYPTVNCKNIHYGTA